MKQMRKLFLAVAMLAVSAVMMVTSSYAWFSMNKEVTANGMVVNATASSSLVIVDTPNVNEAGASTVTLTAKGTNLNAVTYDSDKHNFKYPTSNDKINPDTGEYSDSEAFTELSADGNGNYYIDYIVYIAASGTALSNQKLNATLTVVDPGAANKADTWKAVSVAYYVGTESVKAALTNENKPAHNATGAVLSNNHTDTLKTVELSSSINLPLSTEGFIPVTIRVYFDGAAKGDGANYVRSSLVYTGEVQLSVVFTVENVQPAA